jgi:hypothetical protein
LLLRRRQLEPERRTLSLDAVESDPPAVRFDDLATEGETEPRAADLARD